MIRSLAVMSLVVLLFSGTSASADSYDDCSSECGSSQAQCVAGITVYDSTGVQEAKDACASEMAVCVKRCHDLDALGDSGYQEKLKKDAEDAERKRQEQEQEQNGGIKVLHFAD
jgi:hypothetical protein